MSLPDLTALKNYLRVETTAEDTALAAILAAAGGAARAYLDRPIEATPNTYLIEDRRASSLSSVAYGLRWESRRARSYLRIPDAPVATSPAVTVTDVDGTVWAATDFRVEYGTGLLRVAESGAQGAFWNFPYTVTATVGLATRSDYATVVEPAISQAILDVAADLYHRRNPAATSEDAGGGVGTRYGRQEETIPNRALDLLAQYRRPQL